MEKNSSLSRFFAYKHTPSHTAWGTVPSVESFALCVCDFAEFYRTRNESEVRAELRVNISELAAVRISGFLRVLYFNSLTLLRLAVNLKAAAHRE